MEKQPILSKKNLVSWNRISPSDQASFYLNILLSDVEQEMGNTAKAIHYRLNAIQIHYSSALLRKTLHMIDSLSMNDKNVLRKKFGALFLLLCHHTDLTKLPSVNALKSKSAQNRLDLHASTSNTGMSELPTNLISMQELLKSSFAHNTQRNHGDQHRDLADHGYTKENLEMALNEMGDDFSSIILFQSRPQEKKNPSQVNTLMDRLLSDI